MSDEDELNRSAMAALQEAMNDPRFESIGQLAQSADLLGRYPMLSGSGDLHSLVAPDGVTIRVIDKSVSQLDLEEIVRNDILRRVLREEHRVLLEQSKGLLECMEILLPRFVSLKAMYKLEKLG